MKKQLASSQFNLMDVFTNKKLVSELKNVCRLPYYYLSKLLSKFCPKQFSELVITFAQDDVTP